MLRVKSNSKIITLIAIIAVACLALTTALAVVLSLYQQPVAEAATTTGDRVEMIDLFNRYPMDAVIGPVDVKDTNNDGVIDRKDLDQAGRYSYIQNDAHKDINGNYTNNIYGIPADRYFDVESYIYTTGTKDSTEGRTLYGWKSAIRAVNPYDATGNRARKIAENGEILDGGNLADDAQPIGIHVVFGSTFYGTTFKYALIVPSDITAVGQGSAAFVGYDSAGTLTTYYTGSTTYTTGTYAKAFTDFACFRNSKGFYDTAPYFWQPRERLAGVYFPANSRLTTIVGSTDAGIAGEDSSNQTKIDDIGKSAFLGCDNMRFMVLPSGVTGIGNGAFYKCTQMVETNIPTSVTSIGDKAYANCSSLLHISIPSSTTINIGTDVFTGCSKLKHVDNGPNYSSTAFPATNSTLFVMGNKPENGKLDTGAFVFGLTSGQLSALALAGETGESASKIFVFPSGADFTNNSDRRRGVTYDYIDCNGEKVKNSLDDLNLNVTQYDIGANFAKDTWCQNVILPKEVKTIGASAFDNSHVRYFETYATTFGERAFYDDNQSNVVNQWFYFHQTKNSSGNYTAYSLVKGTKTVGQSTVVTNSFRAAPGDITRHIIFEDQDLYKFATASTSQLKTKLIDLTTGSGQQLHYQIPIIANVVNEDNITLSLKQSDMSEYFFNDSDYVSNPVINPGVNAITYTKRLSGNSTFSNLKKATGEWDVSGDSNAVNASPVFSNMDSTQWFTDTTYATSTNASTLYNSATTTTSSSSISKLNIYTKNIARPANIKNGTYDGVYKGQYTFGETYTFGSNSYTLGDDQSQNIGFYTTLGIPSANYSLDVPVSSTVTKTCDFVFPNGDPGVASNLHNAGTYSFAISLNPKWGVWSEAYKNAAENQGYFNASITVARKRIDYSSLDKIPQFVNAAGDNVMHGNATPLYNYNDGWYAAQQNGAEPNDTRTVTNAYCYYTGKPITVKLLGEVVSADGTSSTLGDSLITFRDGLEYINSSRYTATFRFEVKTIDGNSAQSNYYFDYGDNSYGISDETSGLTMSNQQWNSFRLTKRWYIVIETNMFVVNGSGTASPYAPVTNTNIHYADTLTAQVPALYKGDAAGKIDFEISFTPVGGRATTIVERTTMGGEAASEAASIGYYINSSMPAGEYVLKLYGASVTVGDKTYPAISGEYVITVLPKALDEASVKAIHNVMNVKGEEGNAYPLNDASKKALHDSITAQVTALNGKLVVPNAANSNYWTLAEQQGYFDTAVSITYNLEGSGNTVFSNASTILNSLNTADKYTLYYCISAKNYETVGGSDNYSNRAEFSFKTTLYTEIAFTDIYKQILDVNNPYFKNVTYTGDTVQTLVPGSQYYSYSFNDKDASGKSNYVNARPKASVTLTLYNPELARWNTEIPAGTAGLTAEQIANASNYCALSADKESLQVYFDILPATNAWSVAPQMPSWSFNGFDKNVNFITAGLLFAGASVTYSLRRKDDAENAWTVGFTVDENGNVDNDTAEWLNKLKPGDYYLRSVIGDLTYNNGTKDVVNVNGITYVSAATISVANAVNTWTETPNVMTWTWGNYNEDRNTISATAAYPALKPTYGENVDNSFVYTNGEAALPVVTFSIKRVGATQAVTGLESFTSYTDVATILATLPAGTYSLTTSVGGSDYYTAIAPTTMNFVIAKATNSWKVTPSITGWQYNAYASNFVKGEPTYGEASNVVYTVSGNGITAFTLTFDASGNLSADSANKLNALSAGDYTIKASLVGTDDYSEIKDYPITFTVSKATSNVWSTHASVSGWTYTQTASKVVAGTATFGSDSAVYTLAKQGENETYTNVTGVVNVNLTTLNNALANNLGAGLYRITVTIAETANYVGATDTLTFRVAKANNSWQTAPFMSKYEWIFGQDSATVTNGVVANNDGGEITVTVTFYKAYQENGAWTVGTKLTPNAMPDQKGYYALVVTANGTDNFNELKEELFFNITMFANSWAKNPENSLTWVWGATSAMANSELVKATAVRPDVVTYSIRGVNGTSYELNNVSQDAIIDTLAALNVGSYVVTVTSAADKDSNYSSVSSSCDITVNNATLVWVKNPVNANWSWSDRATKAEQIVEPQVNDKDGNAVSLKYALKYGNVTVEDVSTYAQLVAALKDKDYDASRACTVTVTAELANYTTETKTFTITVTQSANAWKESVEFTQTLSKRYQTAIEQNKVTMAEAKFGDVTYKRGENTFTTLEDLVADINALSVGDYSYQISVAESAGKYNGITATLKVTVLGIASSWDNEADIKANYTFTYDSDTIHTMLGSVVIPTKDESLKTGDKVSYTLSYTPFYPANAQTATYDYASKQALIDELAKQGAHHAGIYTITAKFEPFDKGYSPLNREVTVTVNRIAVELDKYSTYNNKDYENDFEGITIPEPVLKIRNTDTVITRTINYTITNAAGDTFDMVGYSTLVARLKALSVGQYTIKFYVAEDVDYTGVASESEQITFRLRINPALNSWKNNSNVSEVSIFRGEKFAEYTPALVVPEAVRGATHILYNGNEIVLAENQTLGAYLDSLDIKAGTHRIDFVVNASPDGNYNGVSASIVIIVSKNANSFTSPLANISWTYSQEHASIEKPKATHDEQIRFTIIGTRINGTPYAVQTFTSFVDFEEEVNALDAGTYTIAATIAETDNYVGASCSATVVVSQFATAWTSSVDSVYTWTYKAASNKAIPAIKINTPALDIAFTVGDTTVTNYNAWLNSQNVGTYILKATVVNKGSNNDVGLNYSALTMQITVVINAADNQWKPSTEEVVSVPESITFVYGGLRAVEPKTIRYQATQNNGSLTITIDGTEVTASNLDGEIAKLGVGTHTVIATVPATQNYKELTSTVTITVDKQTEKWMDSKATLAVGVTLSNGQQNYWWWRDKGWSDSTWTNPTLPVPTYAEYATVTVVAENESVNTINLVVYYDETGLSKHVRQSDMDALVSRMKALNVGKYEITVTVEATNNYSGVTATKVFEVKQATNDFSLEPPHVENWSYNGTAKPTATPTFGNKNDVVFEYAQYAGKPEDEPKNIDFINLSASDLAFLEKLSWTATVPTEAGKYYLKGSIAGTANYSGAVGYNSFMIGATTNEWIDNASVITWSWNGYDRKVNLFGGSAKGGYATFTISKQGGGVLAVGDFLKLDGSNITEAELNLLASIKHEYVTENGVEKKTNYIKQSVADVLNWLRPGNYTLTVIISGDDNYSGLTNTVNFTVSPAANRWTQVPEIVSYVYGTYTDSPTFKAGVTTYGEIKYNITTTINTTQKIAEGNSAAIINALKTLPAGSYYLNALLDDDSRYVTSPSTRQIQFDVLKADNAWTDEATHSSQISGIWTDIQALTDLSGFYAAYTAKDGTVRYSVLKSDYSVYEYKPENQTQSQKMEKLTYSQLLENLKVLGIGQYFIRATVEATTNYNGLSPIDTALVISSRENWFHDDTNSEKLTAHWKQKRDAQGNLVYDAQGNPVNDSILDSFTFTAEYGEVKFVYAGSSYDKNGLINLVKTFNAGSYNITAVVDEDNDYAGLSQVVMLIVGAGKNSWLNESWKLAESITVNGTATVKWTWGDKAAWQGSDTLYGNTVYVEIRKENAASASHYITLDYSKDTTTTIKNINDALSGLDAGNYTLTVTAPATVNWQELKAEVAFVVDIATTKWVGNGVPGFIGDDVTKVGSVYTWKYGATKVAFNAAVNNGAQVTYYKDGVQINSLPTEAGDYVIKFVVAATANYTGLSQDVSIKITKASLTTFSEGPSANSWTWDAFNRINHRFVAVPDSQGAVTFSVLNAADQQVFVKNDKGNDVALTFTLVNDDGRLLVSEDTAKLLNKLTAGTYKLKVDVAATDNYVAFSDERATFTVSEATNTWTITPSVAPWSLNQFKEAENSPVGKARYGYVDIVIRSDVNDEVFYHKYFDETKGEYVVEHKLNEALVGWYTMTATVAKAEGKYNNGEGEDLTGSMRFQIFVKGSTEVKNYWIESPSIEGWIANFDGVFNMPVAEPARGRVYFEFFKAVKNADGSYSRGAKITKDDYVTTVTNENGQYVREWYVPVEPGFYYMDAHAVVSGMEDPIDTIGRTPFEIYYRTNSFTAEPRIDTLLYLGDKANWADPTLAVLEENSEITLHYYDKDGNDLGSTIPTVAGTYYLVATVEAPFCRTLESKRVEFKVELSQNSWTSAPSIKDWSEEFDPSNPTGSALVGSENIVYEWAFADKPDERYNYTEKKPVEEGSYILYATLIMDGYADLDAEPYPFVIEPAYDADLLLVDIILGLFASALAVAVTVFAIRRYKEN